MSGLANELVIPGRASEPGIKAHELVSLAPHREPLSVIVRCERTARASKDVGHPAGHLLPRLGRRPSRLASLAPQGDGTTSVSGAYSV
jgi:hypothetical protein